jgi:hypothetical protein
MKTGLLLGVLILIGGCAGVQAGVSWPDSGPREQEPPPPPPPEEITSLSATPQSTPPSEGPRRFKCEDPAMRFENSPLQTHPDLRGAVPAGNTPPRLPRSLMDPWRSFAPSGTPSSELLWPREVPGVTDGGFFGAGPGWAR